MAKVISVLSPQLVNGPSAASRRHAHLVISQSLRAIWRHDVCGLGYVSISLALGIYSLAVEQPYLVNDFFWTHFVSANVPTALANAFNTQLALTTHSSVALDLLAPSSGVSFADVSGVSVAYPRLLMYQELTTLDVAVVGLRNLEPVYVVSMVAQYCWVDFERRWAMAHTYQRQVRCRDRYATNAAVYMESVLRNVDFNAWVASTQGHFTEGIATGIAEASDGQAFLDYLATHTMADVPSEIRFWQSRGLETFVLQYANAFQIGLEEYIQIENALGWTNLLRIKTISSRHRGTQWTTDYMYAGLLNDFSALSGNQSLVQNASTFFGLTNDNAMEEYNVCTPLSAIYQAVHDQIGQLANIDLLWVPLPIGLADAIRRFRAAVLTTMETDPHFAVAFAAVGIYALHPTPAPWQNASLLFYGGNPMCGANTGLPFVQESFGFDDACATQSALSVNWSPWASLFAALMVSAPLGIECNLLPATEFATCRQGFAALEQLRARTLLVDSIGAASTVAPLNLSFVQFVGVNGTVWMETLPLLDSTFAFFGWMTVYEWAMNLREVVSFEGDQASVVLMSYASLPQPPPVIGAFSSFATYIWYCCAVVSAAMTAIGMLLVFLWLYESCPSRTPWLKFNRIVSATWLNRTLLLIRGIAALLCLASATATPARGAGSDRFIEVPRPIGTSCLLAGEALWVAYVIHETLHPLTGTLTAQYAPPAAALSWLTLVVIDIGAPIQPSAALARSCFSKNMDQMLYCISGTVSIGSAQRVLTNMTVLVGVSALCYFLSLIMANKRHSAMSSHQAVPSLLLPGLAIAFMDPTDLFSKMHASHINSVTAAMCGILRFRIRNREIVFDSKLWIVPTDLDTSAKRLSIPYAGQTAKRTVRVGSTHMRVPTPPTRVSQWITRLSMGCGVVYTISSLCSNVLFLTVAQAFLANDFGWSGFNSTGMHAFLANTFNAQLLRSANAALNLTSPVFADVTQLYNGSVAPIVWSPHAARRQLVDASVPLSAIVQGLRDMDPCKLPSMATQYCWLDFHRVWDMASTPARQKRCIDGKANAAVYLEAPLRNIADWASWERCWGQSYDTAISSHLRATAAGTRWLGEVASNTLSIDEEVDLWTQFGLTRFQLQWQNYKTMGMTDLFTITSSLGYVSSLTQSRSSGSYHMLQQTSLRMYWTLASDLWAVTANSTLVGGHSLVASSPVYAFTNTSSEALLFQNLTLLSPLSPGLSILRSTVGPFGAVDMRVLGPPVALVDLFNVVMGKITTLLATNATAQTAFFAIPAKPRVCEVPPFLLSHPGIQAAGGNLMCGDDLPPEPASYGLYSGFGATNVCHANFLETMQPTTAELLFALSALYAESRPSPTDFQGICDMDMCAGDACAHDLALTAQWLEAYPIATASRMAITVQAVRQLGLETTQFYLMPSSTTMLWYRLPLLAPTERLWSFYGWCFLYEWVTGAREAVSFEGDTGSVAALTQRAKPLSMSADPAEIPGAFSAIFLGCTFYITWLLICTAALVTIYSMWLRGRVEGNNLFELNRIVGHVWAGRTFLIIRSVTAIWILSTTPLLLEQVDRATLLTSPPRPWYQTVLAGSEVTWLVYTLNDVFSCFTMQYTTRYAYKSSLATWVAVVVWSFLSPRTYTAQLHRTCTHVDMDFELVCTSAAVGIGSTSSMAVVAALALVCVVLAYVVERLLSPHLAPLDVHSYLLNSQSLYMLDLTHWQYGGDFYLDKTSAVMAGILSVEYQDNLYMLDIKTWRTFSTPATTFVTGPDDSAELQHVRQAIPLSRF
ncbi:hypothetical protein ACHHYP_05550 [Achlya hypogyna]|uniref:Uncharacterized protein n=1 Tax=Achlya hypogyna TaxID=1202772 RepID=A0A1V9YX59_ACHHY|nr:hypothetical protein ACHHYP_05550 [Achlya hypogyna]